MRKHFMFKVLLTLVVGLFLSVGAFAQQIAVKGIVKDTTGEPVIGANVLVKGTTNGTITDFDGNFQLMANQGDIIVISFIGYSAQELPATAELMNVVLKDDSEMLSEVVVIGYGVAKKNDLTGSVTAVKPDEMNKGLVTNAQDMMQGKIAGVNVTSASGTPGAGATIRIRGGSSLNASNDPLIVIDGLAMDNNGVKGLSNPLSMVNPADIESFTVLKDASATAIYGSRGSNGVIIITTKKGRTGSKPSISYNGNVSVSMKKNTIDVMDGDQFRSFIGNMYGTDSPAYAALGTANTDWQSEIYRAAISTDHNVTISGGLKNMPYRISVGYTNQQGILKTSDFQRYTASVNLSPSFFEDHLKVNLNAKGMIAKTGYANTDAVNAAVWMDPTQSVKDSREQFKNFGGYFQWLGSGAALNDPTWDKTYNSLATKNPVALLEQQDKNADSKTFIGNAEFDYKVHGFEDLRLHMNLGGDFSKGEETTVITPQSSTNAYYGWDGWDKSEKYNLMFNAYAQYMKDFNDAHHFDIMGGYEWQHFH
ncbi:MAG: SusC/RagA family TonB-linked outer membrane protein, partial [Bacteroides sp.]|nr:SusC/RagA family TonB-linked outer membrane protein [Bacteroides sp.]